MRDISVKTGIRPFFNAFYVSMLHRIPMNVIDVLSIIRFVTDKVLPKPPLHNISDLNQTH
jgi:hypothetical protein